ncbi:MAG: O-antigen ligase family protein, partial [bacterium]
MKRSWRGERIGLLGALREIVLGILSGVIPWWFGANDPPAIYLISSLILVLGLLTLVESIVQNKQTNLLWRQVLLAPPVAVLGLVSIFGFIQWVEISPDLLQTLSPNRFKLWEELGGKSIIVPVAGGPSFQLPARIAWLEAEVYESVVWLASLWVLCVCVLRLPGRWGPLKRHSLVMVVSASLMGIQSMLQAMTFTGKILWIRQAHIVISSAGPFFVHSHLASFLNIGLGFAIAHICFMGWQGRKTEDQEHLFNEQRQGVGKGIFWVYSAGLIMVSVLASGSRGGMLAMLMAMALLAAVWVVFAQRLRKIASGSMEWKWVIGLAVAVLFSLTLFTDVFAIFSRARGLVGREGGHAAGVRRRVWALAWESWKDAPLWGTGWGSYVWASQRHYHSAVGYSTHAESDYVQVLPEGGMIGMLMLLAGLAGLFWCVLRVVRKVEQPNQMALVGGCVFALVAVAWGSLTENNLRTAGIAIPALITAAHLVRLSAGWQWFESKNWDEELAAKKVRIPSRVFGVSMGILLVSLAWIGRQQTWQVNWAWGLLRNADL